jgi:hypothetical protein
MSLALLAVPLVGCGAEEPDPPLDILFLSKSSEFQHGVIARKDGSPSFLDGLMSELASLYDEDREINVNSTKDASLVNAENLKNYDLVVFYTTGDLTKPGRDGNPPMGENGVAELIEWIEGGGAFMGFHCAADTFWKGFEGTTEYTKMLGASFAAHGKQFEGTLRVVSPGHPAIENLPDGLKINDEWYLFNNLNTEKIHVLALLDPGEERKKQEKYDIPNYPVIWCRTIGDGRMYYNAMGHREDVWTNEIFQLAVIDAVEWVLNADGDAPNADPNYAEVVPEP